MRCPSCQALNSTAARFCEDCGERLTRSCPRCHADVTSGKNFCWSCGERLVTSDSDPVSAPLAYTPKHLAERILTTKASLEGERKRITVLFADIKASMELMADRDPEEARKLLDPVIEYMMEAVHRYEGTVNQLAGDGIMALFGAPLAHEDHAVRACYAAFEMQATIKRHAQMVRRADGVEVQIRAGLSSGEVVVSTINNDLRMDYITVGKTAHLAARMEQIATPGTIRLTEDTLRLAHGFINVRSLGLVPIKGLKQPINVYELTGVLTPRSRFHSTAKRGLTRFVARENELEVLHEALALTATGRGQVRTIVGEPGLGKSRIVWELAHSHRVDDWLVLQAGAVSYRKTTSYLPIVDLLKGYFGVEESDDSTTICEKLTRKLLALDRALQVHLPALLALLDVPSNDPHWSELDPPQRRRRTMDALKELLLRESEVQPLLLVIEDLHWIDPETQAALDALVESLSDDKIFLLVNCRPEYQQRWQHLDYYAAITLDPLPTASAERFLLALLGTDGDLKQLKQTLIAKTGGNPFFIEESVRALVEIGALTGKHGTYQPAKQLPEIQVPGTVQAVLAARIDRLSLTDKTLLQTASILGRYVPLNLLQSIADVTEDQLKAAIERLQAAEFLNESGLLPGVEYSFKHALTHEVAYGSLLQDRRRALHMRVVETIEQTYPDRLIEHVDRLAHHALLGEDWAKAVAYLQKAGAKAFARSAHHEAVRLFKEALAVLPHLPETKETLEQAIDLRFDLRNALLPLAEWGSIEKYLEDAEVLARNLGDQRRLASVSGYMAGLHLNTTCQASAIRAFAREIEAIGRTLDDVPLQIAGQYYRVWLGALTGDHRGNEKLCRELLNALSGDLSLTRLGLVAYPSVVSHAFLARALAELGELSKGGELGHEAIRLAEEFDHSFSLIWACLNLGHLERVRGDFKKAEKLVEHAAALSQEWNMAYLTPITLATLGSVYVASGRIEDGVSSLERALDGYASSGIGYMLALSLVYLGEAKLFAGELEQAWDVGNRAVALAHERNESGHEAWAHRLLGDIASHNNRMDLATAETCYAKSAALALTLGMRPLLAHCHLGRGKVRRRAGNRRASSQDLTAAINFFDQMGSQFWSEKANSELKAVKTPNGDCSLPCG